MSSPKCEAHDKILANSAGSVITVRLPFMKKTIDNSEIVKF